MTAHHASPQELLHIFDVLHIFDEGTALLVVFTLTTLGLGSNGSGGCSSGSVCLTLQGDLAFIGAVACGLGEMAKFLIGHSVNPDFRVNDVSQQG